MANKKALIIGFLVLLVVAVGAYFVVGHRSPDPLPSIPQADPSPMTEVAGSPIPSPVISPSPLSEQDIKAPSSKRMQQSFENVKSRYGADLQAMFSQDGRVTQLRGRVRPDLKGKTGFSTKDPGHAKKLATELIQSARDALGITGRSPVGDPLVQTGDISAQVYFRQLYEGLVVQPHGTITVNLGPSGELIQLDSDYLPGVRVTNWASISPDQALAAVPKFDDEDSESGGKSTGRILGGSLIVWAVPGTEARKAYEYYSSGRQVIVDAQTGKVISTRDRRMQ
ncbi:MAG: PepSY domain-containing protein [Bdellovibrionales bacterium]|nr:PepSY domain-containing protein [Bdellovibrionales bacterium]